jgi:hypothetical protein
MPSRFGTQDLLEYNENYRVIICRDCKYAIQKNALGSHLLRHKIYRSERQHLLTAISQLDLLEPEDVLIPPGQSPAVDGLPVISGYKCTANGCVNLCASTKRMRRHWSEAHGMSTPPEPFAESVNLQTFFRGTKLKYFEVFPASTSPTGTIIAHAEGSTGIPAFGSGALFAASPEVPKSPQSRPLDLDLVTLTYFHHYITTTSLTLPTRSLEHKVYWQNDVVMPALQLHWMMCGILAISASHLIQLSDDLAANRVHQSRHVAFYQAFICGWEEAREDTGTVSTDVAEAAAMLLCIQRCYHWASNLLAHDQIECLSSAAFALETFMTTIQGCVSPEIALRSLFGTAATARETLGTSPDNVTGSPPNNAGSGNMPPTGLLEIFHTLPFRMSYILGKPDNAIDVLAALSAINVLVRCTQISYATDDSDAAWLGMELWLRKLSNKFNNMIICQSPASLIVLANWSLLVRRAEHYHWFLRGSSIKLLSQILEEVDGNEDIRTLVESLMRWESL